MNKMYKPDRFRGLVDFGSGADLFTSPNLLELGIFLSRIKEPCSWAIYDLYSNRCILSGCIPSKKKRQTDY